jgi:hypothetical protein
MTHVLIATPTADGIVKALYATTLVKTVLAVKDAGWGVDFVSVDSSIPIFNSRNYFSYLLLRQPHFTHLVMIDSDMSFEGNVICRLLSCDKPVVAAAYSQRRMDMEAFTRAARNSALELAELHALALEYNIQIEIESGARQYRHTRSARILFAGDLDDLTVARWRGSRVTGMPAFSRKAARETPRRRHKIMRVRLKKT